jgi:hypothetical protein
MRPTCKIPAQLLYLAKSYGLPKLTTYNVYIKIAILGTPINCPGKLYLSEFRDMNMSDCNKSWSDHQKYDRAIQP